MKQFFTFIKRNCTYLNLFMFISGTSIIIFLCYNFFHWGSAFNTVIMGPNCQFADYFTHIAFSTDRANLYRLSYDACFPPLSYCMYYFFWRTSPYLGDVNKWEEFKYSDNALTIFVIYNIFITILLLYCVQLYIKGGFKYQVLLPMIIVFSYSFLGTSIQRGNAIVFVSILLSISFYWKDEKAPIKRELAMILIAIATGFKVYPAIIGIQYIKERRFKETIRLLCYGLLFFFGPFVFFGGKQGLFDLFSLYLDRGLEDGNLGTVRGMLKYFIIKYTSMSKETMILLIFIAEIAFLCISLLCFWLTKKDGKKYYFFVVY